MNSENDIKAGFIQHSKRLAVYGIAQWMILCGALIGQTIVFPVSDVLVQMFKDIISGSATLAGVIVTGYMGNSAIEKFAAHKYNIASLIGNEDKGQG